MNGQVRAAREVIAPAGVANLIQRLALEHIVNSSTGFDWPSDLRANCASSDAARAQLLRNAPGYCDDGAAVRPCAKDLVSWPAA
eukprot:3139060-Pyramimonas_sp.AAC.1